MNNTNVPFLELEKITKTYGKLVANDSIDLFVNRGEVLSLLGENGSGKTTLMNVIYGLHMPDSGTIRINGVPTVIRSPKEALQHKIGMVHQHFMLIPNLDVTENIILGLEEGNRIFVDKRAAAARIRKLGETYGLQVNPDALVSSLSVGMQQRVEILKALYRGVELLILDEPTAVLTPLEVRDFFAMLKNLVANGLSAIFISHKLEEVLEISERVTVLNRGKVVGTIRTAGATRKQLAEMMVGRTVQLETEKDPMVPGDVRLSLDGISKTNEEGIPVLKNISLSVRSGEILGIAGVDGNGQQELADILTGMQTSDSGEYYLEGGRVTNRPPKFFIDRGVSCVPADRQKTGAVMDLSIRDNLILKTSDRKPVSNLGILNRQVISDLSSRAVEKYDIRTESTETAFSSLSGGNQQKVILAREIESDPGILIVCYPTRGLDIGATEYVHQCILEQRSRGAAVILISAELEEIMSLSDSIAVMFRGEIMGTLANDGHCTVEMVGRMMLGEKRG